MNFDQLNYIVDLSKTYSITATANRFFCTQQAVSESIKRLEKELNCHILQRTNKGVQFTDAGKLVLRFAMQQTAQLTQLQSNLSILQNQNTVSGRLQIGMGPMAAGVIISKLIFQLNRTYPNITPIMQEYSMDMLLQVLQEGEVDFAILGSYNAHNFDQFYQAHQAEYRVEKLYADELVCVMSKDNPLAQETVFRHGILEHMPHTMYAVNSEMEMNPYCLHVSNQTEIHQYFMRERNTFCLIPYNSYLALYEPKGFICKPIEDAAPVVQYLVWKELQPTVDESVRELYEAFISSTMSVASIPIQHI